MSGAQSPDPYDRPPTFVQRHADGIAAGTVFALTVLLTVASFPPCKAPECAYAMAVPAVFWAYLRPRLRLYAWTLFAAQAVAWTILLAWLRHVTWVGLLLLGPFVGAWVGAWYLAAWWAMPQMLGRSVPVRLAAQMGLAGLWVVVEWTRSWLFGGFPWLPLAASQWQRASILQISAYTGAWGVSFVLVAMNVGFAAYLHRLLREGPALVRSVNRRLAPGEPEMEQPETRDWGLRRRSQEFLLALFLLLVCLCIFMVDVQPFARRAETRPFARVAFVQPYIPSELKWDPAEAPGIVRILRTETLAAADAHPGLILWPEAVTPWAVNRDPSVKDFVDSLSAKAAAPILFGSVAVDAGKWYNAAFVATPDLGLQRAYYAKRKLVAFGEYIPLRPLLGWISKFVPIGDDFTPGSDASPLVVSLKDGPAAFGPLICYEDTYPQLARASVLEGSDVLAVLTNNGWFGEGGAAYQHAAHSVLRAVETRRPVLRCGNGGWSGWIDEFGGIRFTFTDADGSVYFRGAKVVDVTRDARWIGRDTFYVEHGDWFVAACAAMAAFGWAALRIGRPRNPAR